MRLADILKDRALHEAAPVAAGPRIVHVQFRPGPAPGTSVVIALYDGGRQEPLFQYNDSEIKFDLQELVGLTRQEARWLKDKKLDQYIGFDQF